MQKFIFSNILLVVLIAYGSFISSALSVTLTSGEDEVAAFYTGKTVRIIVGYPPGGGFDAYSRVIGRHISKHIPGSPTVIIENMAGAGSIIAANYVFNTAPKDGTIIGNLSGPIILEQLFGNPGVQFDMAKFRYIAVPVAEVYLMLVTKKSGIRSLEELLGWKPKQATIGAIPNTTIEHAPLLLRDVVGINLKVVSGYKGSADIRLAMDSGEIDGFFNTWTSAKISALELIKNGEWLVLTQMTDIPLNDLPVSKVPEISAIAKTEKQRQLLRLGTAVPSQFGKVYVMAPGVSEKRALVIESAFAKTFADPEFLKDADKGKIEIEPLSANKASSLVSQFLAMPGNLKANLREIIHGHK
jgi:tripartite-type tricarboxylate transporter receptor subunit TctC